MTDAGNPTQEDEEVMRMREAFEMFDHDGNGTITKKELTKVVQLMKRNPTEEDVENILKKIDKDGNNKLDFEEFKTFMSVYKCEHKNEKEEITNAFRVFDKDNNGQIELKELKHILHGLGQTLSDTEIEEMIGTVDANNDGKINYEEFVNFICKN